MGDLTSRLAAIQSNLAMVTKGIDREKVALAETILCVRGSYANAGDDRFKILRKAIDDISAGCPILVTRYLGTKNYERWHGQGIECTYGMGPSHGSVIFGIELRTNIRQRLACGHLTDEEKEAALYYLVALSDIQDCKEVKP
jgi:hypothetical protein